MKKYVFLTLSLLIFASLWLGIDRYLHPKSLYFLPHKVYSHFAAAPKWDLPSLSMEEQKEIDSILQQQWTYLGHGAQAYAFLSQDGQYVLKFFRQNKFRASNWMAKIEFTWNPYYRILLKKQQKAEETFLACKTAYTHFRKETGTIYTQLNPSPSRILSVLDKDGQSHIVDLGKTSFILQKKADLVYPHIEKLMKANDLPQAKTIVTKVIDFFFSFVDQGVVDNDAVVRKNFGIIENEVVQFDIGHFKIENTCDHKDYTRIRKTLLSFQEWISSNFPELSEHFETALDQAEKNRQVSHSHT